MNLLKKIHVFCFLFLALNMFSKDIYVAKNGNDSNSGTQESPYLTITKAASVAVAGDIVYIKEGTYEETLTPLNSGTAGNPIVFQSFPGDRVIISAMESLSGWTQDNGSIYKTIIPFNSLGQENFVMNGETACDLARWPNKTDENPFKLNSLRNTGGSGPDVATNAYLTEASIPSYDWTDGAVWFYGDKAGSGWTAWKRIITSSSAGRVNFNLTFGANESWVRTFHAPADLGDFYLEGVKDALDYKNEWYYNPTTKELFIQLPNGSAPVDDVVKMRRRNETINLKDKSYIEIRNLAVFGGSINMEDSSTWQANGNNRTTNNVLYGISSFYGSHTQGAVESSRSGKASVNMQGSNNIIEKCEIAFNAAAGIQARGNNHTILDNYIHDFDFLSNYDAPLVVRGINNSIIKNNTIFNGGRDAIQYYGTNNELSYNDVSRSNLLADDCGLFYTTGSQYITEIHHNWFHDAASSGDKKKAAGIYLDNDAAGFSVHHNVVWNTEWTSIQINWNGKDIDIFNNTLWNGEAVMGAWHLDGTSFTNVRVWNNIGSDDKWEPQSDKQNNLTEEASVFVDSANDNFNLKQDSNPIEKGKVIAGITDGFVGSSPDVGAYEYGGDNWVAGITWDYNYGPTGLGCYGLPGENCVTLPKNDQDKDGVADENDLCPDTPLNTTVNTKGCPVFQITSDNFKVLSTGEVCASSNNGSITITATEEMPFTAEITQTGTTKNFTKDVTFENLTAGLYTVCITTSNNADYKQCFNVKIVQPAALKVSAKVEKSTQQVVLKLEGSDLYRIELNDVITVTDQNEITLNLKVGENKLKVKTAIDCQGIYNDKIQVFNAPIIYPNPVLDYLNLALPNNLNEIINYKISTSTGQTLIHKEEKVTPQPIKIDVRNLKTGIYFIKVNGSKINFHSKIIKQ